MIHFDDPRVCGGESGLFEIKPSEVIFEGKNNHQVRREMIPFVLCFAVTVHKVQGVTLLMAVLNLGSDLFSYAQAYVALSRVKTLNGLAIEDLDVKKLRVM